MRLAGKIGIVTAAASGMGRAGALRFAREGAQVAVVDVDAAGVQRVVSEIAGAGGTAVAIAADAGKPEGIDAKAKKPLPRCVPRQRSYPSTIRIGSITTTVWPKACGCCSNAPATSRRSMSRSTSGGVCCVPGRTALTSATFTC